VNSQSLAAPALIGGRYAVERELGRGATSTVYLCRDRQTMSSVAVKVLRPELAESVGADRFLREIRVTSGLEHPNIVPILDSGADGSLLYCVLPLMEGGTLRDRLLQEKQLPIEEAIRIGRSIAIALQHAHSKGLIHRDIKPENILFSHGEAVLGDFGIARLLHATAGDLTTTTTGVVRGTPAYMSPEQASGERDYDGRSDIYSLACVIYEMVSGMPPFIGPTAQSVLAQRFSSTPRAMRVYRNSVPPQLDAVIGKAMALTPADRFASADDLQRALAGVEVATARHRRVRPILIASAAGVMVALLAFYFSRASADLFGSRVRADTTQITLLPFERDGDVAPLGSIDGLLYDAFASWNGISVVEPVLVRAALQRETRSGPERDRSVALSLGSGRFITGSVATLPANGGWVFQAWLQQVDSRGVRTIAHSRAVIAPSDLGSINLFYARLAQALLVRGTDSSLVGVASSSSLPAAQAFASGVDAVVEWDLAAADSAFGRATALDPDYRRAYFSQAQVRFWQNEGSSLWLPLAQKALGDTSKLPGRDRALARALTALGMSRFEESCAIYDSIAKRNPGDFDAWFGAGRCRDLDYRIVPDSKSSTGWRYVSSYDDAVGAYRKAFESLSLSHRSLERGSFDPLRDLLFIKPSKMQAARAVDTSQHFIGRLDLEDGRLLLRPMPASLIAAGDPSGVPTGLLEALRRQRQLFASIASSWSTAIPRSPGAKEAVAVALELRGDRSALDTLTAARRLAVDDETKLRLAAADVILRLKFADPSRDSDVSRVRSLADSLLRANRAPSARAGGFLAPIAVVAGRCDQAADFAARAPRADQRGVPRDLVGAAEAEALRVILDCAPSAISTIQDIEQRIAHTPGAEQGAVQSLMTRPVVFLMGRDTTLTLEYAKKGGAYMLNIQRYLIRGLSDSVRVVMSRVGQARARTGYEDIAPDAIYVESRAQLAIGDTTEAVQKLDRLLGGIPTLTPGMLAQPIAMAGLLQSMRLRDQIAAARGETDRRWGKMLKSLWSPR
jgi:tRNA A-37 threonylcarbamoyl transferase component Bud32/tetratricopeptide (TPR) repeat protein